MLEAISTQKEKLEQKKARLLQQEATIKLKERKTRVRHLITVGGLVAKAEIDHLPTDTLYGAFLSIKDTLTKDAGYIEAWAKVGGLAFNSEVKKKTTLILTMAEKPPAPIRNKLRSHNLKWNTVRREWYGMVTDLNQLQLDLKGLKFELELVQT